MFLRAIPDLLVIVFGLIFFYFNPSFALGWFVGAKLTDAYLEIKNAKA